MTIGFDADVLIYATLTEHPNGASIRALLASSNRLVGSALLMPEVLIKPTRFNDTAEREKLMRFLTLLELYPLTQKVASTAVSLGAAYGLKTVDAAHLATAVESGADTFLTNNRKDFKKEQVLELTILHPDDL